MVNRMFVIEPLRREAYSSAYFLFSVGIGVSPSLLVATVFLDIPGGDIENIHDAVTGL